MIKINVYFFNTATIPQILFYSVLMYLFLCVFINKANLHLKTKNNTMKVKSFHLSKLVENFLTK